MERLLLISVVISQGQRLTQAKAGRKAMTVEYSMITTDKVMCIVMKVLPKNALE